MLILNWGENVNLTSLEEWMCQGKAAALEHSLKFFNELKAMVVQIILVSSRREHLRSATIDNRLDVGYHGWTSLVLRSVFHPILLKMMRSLFHMCLWQCFWLIWHRGQEDELSAVQKYKANVRAQLLSAGHRIWGIIVADQYSSFEGLPSVQRTFKLPNPLYYVSWYHIHVTTYFVALIFNTGLQ